MAGKTCQICGENSGFFPLCKEHNEMKEKGLVVKNEKTGKWELKEEIIQNDNKSDSELTCLICGKNSNGKHFCFDCWNKYKDRSFDLRITNCNKTQILDEYGNRTRRTKDGRLVRSLAEKIILDHLFDNYIRVIYEKTIPYTNEKGEEKELHPDFYLPDYDLYIEYNGLSNKSYLKRKDYAYKIYQEQGLRVVILESEDIDELEKNMGKLLEKYKKV